METLYSIIQALIADPPFGRIFSLLYLIQPPPFLLTSHQMVISLGGVTKFLMISEQEHNCVE